jgi:3-phytase
MVVDDSSGIIYAAEENVGIWKFNANPDAGFNKEIIKMSQKENNKNIEYDIEGLTLYYGKDAKGYLIASSQGNFSYAVFDRITNNYLFSFKIIDGIVDGAEETDGIDVTSANLGLGMEKGIFVVQDGFNYDGEDKKNQNFKYVSWESIINSVK